uniref:Uncharacterized protein n=1 Tax=Kalanchoe fedtschenkoi TaxID=63787 RepID=A0A7N0V1K9_KALFE
MAHFHFVRRHGQQPVVTFYIPWCFFCNADGAPFAGLNRSGKSCRLRWLNYLKPDIKSGNMSEEEEDLIQRLHKLLGNIWSLIAGRLPGRTDNEIKNYWNLHLKKRVLGD